MASNRMLQISDRVHASLLALMLIAASVLIGCSHKEADADHLAATLQVKPGMVLADVGAGSGWMTVMMAGLVGPKGHVFSTEINPQDLSKIRDAVAAAQLSNVTVVQATASATGLPTDCCDAIVLRRVYHHLTDPADTDRSLLKALHPGGRLAVLDFRPTILLWPWTPKNLPPNREGHGIDPMIVIEELKHTGFEYLSMEDPWPGSWFISSYCLLFAKPPQVGGKAPHGIVRPRSTVTMPVVLTGELRYGAVGSTGSVESRGFAAMNPGGDEIGCRSAG